MEDRDTYTPAFNCPNCGAAVESDSVVCVYCGSSVAARICPSCFGSVCSTMKHCPRCGTELPDPEVIERDGALACPLCETGMALISARRYKLRECLECGGLWIDKNSFQDICRIEEERESTIPFRYRDDSESAGTGGKKRKRAYIPCPECGKLMNHKSFTRGSGIVLDWCRDHGSWFDRQELQQVIAFIRNGGLEKSRERERLYLEGEKARLRLQKFDPAVGANRMDACGASAPEFHPSGNSFLRFLRDTLFD
jgi:Zn-finger nucleic acid-binding protein